MALTLQQFGATIKKKHPEYNDMTDEEVGQKVLKKYPQYQDMVDTGSSEPTPAPQAPQPTEQPKQEGSWLGNQIANTSILGIPLGAAADIGKSTIKSTAKGVANGTKGVMNAFDYVLEKVGIKKPQEQKDKESEISNNISSTIDNTDLLKAKNIPQGLSDFIGEAITYVAPFTKVGQASKAAGALVQSPKLAAIIQAGVEALGGAGISAATSKDGSRMSNALTTGAVSGGLSALGSIVTPFLDGVAHKLYNQTYKQTIQEAEKAFGNTDPREVADVAQWALDKGIKGSVKTQSNQVSNILNQSEKAIISEAQNIKELVPVPNQAVQLAQELKAEFGDYGQGEVANKIGDFLRSVTDNGQAPIEQVIYFRRLLDNLRTKSSFRNPKIGDNVAYWADNLRGVINSIPELGAVNKDYSLAMKAKDALVAAAKNGANRRFVNLWSELVPALAFFGIGGGGIKGAIGAGMGVAGIKALQSPAIQTTVGSGLSSLSKAGPQIKPILQSIGKQVGEKVNPPQE